MVSDVLNNDERLYHGGCARRGKRSRSGGSMPEADVDKSGSEGGGGGAAGASRGVVGFGVVRPEDPMLTVLP